MKMIHTILFAALALFATGCSTTREPAQVAIAQTDAQTRAHTGALAYEDGVHIQLDRQYVAINPVTGEPFIIEGRPIITYDKSRASWNWNGDASSLNGVEVELLHSPGSGFTAKTASIGSIKETGVNLDAMARGAAAQKVAAGEALAEIIRADWAGRVQAVEVLSNGAVKVIDAVGRSIIVTPTAIAGRAVEKWMDKNGGGGVQGPPLPE